MKTRAAILVMIKQSLVVDEVVVPKLRRGQVLVKMKAAGLCRSQLSEINGWRGKDPYLPHLLGHEGSANVVKVGGGVEKVKRGDYVVVSWIKGSGMDAPGGLYEWKGKIVNSGGAAVFSQYAVVAENRVTKVSRKVPADVAAIIGCAVATGAGMVRHSLRAKKGSRLAIFGVGGIGASAVMAARQIGCKDVIAVDISKKKLAWAKKLGATEVKKAGQGKIADLDYAVEATGLSEVMEQAFEALNNTGTLVIAGHPKLGTKIKIDPYSLICGKRIIGTWGGETVPDKDFPYYARQYMSGKLPLKKLITHRYSLDKINAALKELDRGDAGRIIIEF
ncbi:MAG: zinc-binding dehydrogenase [bacterium]